MTPHPALRRLRSTPRRARLSVEALEDRATPATAVYSALTQTLTVTGAQGDRIEVAAIPNKPTGYIRVTETQAAATVFDSDVSNKGVRNLVVRFSTVNAGALSLNSGLRLGGNLAVLGARVTQELDLLGTVGGNVTYTAAAGTAVDDVDVESVAQVGGNLILGVGGGANTVRLKGGTIRGNLSVTGGAGIDRVELTATGDLNVGASATISLGEGKNDVVGIALHLVQIGSNFTYIGGGGNDTFDLDGSGGTLQVGQDARFTFGNPIAFDANLATYEALNIGRNLIFVGGAGGDSVTASGGMLVGGNVTATLGEGVNSFDSNLLGVGVNAIGGAFTYTGGTGGDAVSLDAASIGRNVTVTLGESGGASQAFNAGAKAAAGVTVFGTLKVTGGAAADAVLLHRTYVGNALTVTTGGGTDTVGIDDVDVAGVTVIDLGGGNDNLIIETAAADSGGTLGNRTTFGGIVTVRAGDGNDSVNLSNELIPDPTTFVHFGARVSLLSGLGNDTLDNTAENIFEVAGNVEDFETLNGPALP